MSGGESPRRRYPPTSPRTLEGAQALPPPATSGDGAGTDDVLDRVRAETAELPDARRCRSRADQGALMSCSRG